jgi:hypothetical protein
LFLLLAATQTTLGLVLLKLQGNVVMYSSLLRFSFPAATTKTPPVSVKFLIAVSKV